MIRYACLMLAILMAMSAFPTAADTTPAIDNPAARCVAEGLPQDGTRVSEEVARSRVRACLDRLESPAGLCNGVPPADVVDVLAAEGWIARGCKGRYLTNGRCHALMDEVAAYCRNPPAKPAR